jgi:hypothetical protein
MNTGIFKNIFISLGIACAAQYLLYQMQSEFVFVFLKSNITTLQVALLALNTSTLSIVLTKIREIIDKTGQREAFDSTRTEMIYSIKEQIFLIAFSLIILALESAKTPILAVPSNVLQAALITSFTYSIFILFDTAKSVFIVLDY